MRFLRERVANRTPTTQLEKNRNDIAVRCGSPISSSLSRITSRFRTCVSDTRVSDTEDSRSQFRVSGCCFVANQMNWVLSGFSRSLFDAIHRRTASMKRRTNRDNASAYEARQLPWSCVSYHPHSDERPGRRTSRSWPHLLCTGHIGEVRGRRPVGRPNGRALRLMWMCPHAICSVI